MARKKGGIHQTLGQMGKSCHPKGLRGLGAKKYIQILDRFGGKVWMEIDIHYESVDKGDFSKIHSPNLPHQLDQTPLKILQRGVYLLESYYKILSFN
jgi:5'-3' exonuclease